MEKQIIGYTTGVFDLFHIGHLNILESAKEMCDILIVGVTTDQLAHELKGRKPIVPFEERIQILQSIKFVDRVVAQTEINELQDHQQLSFDIIFKGDDWKNTKRWIQLKEKFSKKGVEVIFFPYTKTTSSTLIRKILEDTAHQAPVSESPSNSGIKVTAPY